MPQELSYAEIPLLQFRRNINNVAGRQRYSAQPLDAHPRQSTLAIAPVLARDDFDTAHVIQTMKGFSLAHHSLDALVIAQLILGATDIYIRAGVTHCGIAGLERRPGQERAEWKRHDH